MARVKDPSARRCRVNRRASSMARLRLGLALYLHEQVVSIGRSRIEA